MQSLKVCRLRCLCTIRNNKDVIRRHANFIINNPNKIHISAAASEMRSFFWNFYNNICVPAGCVLTIA